MAKISVLNVANRTGTENSREVSLSIKDIHIEEISIRENIRQEYKDIAELKESIRTYGLLQPITIYRHGDSYAVKTGHRRFLAYQELYKEEPNRFHSIRCIISDNADIQVIQLIENVQRVDLSQKELYDALVSLREQGLTHKQIADIMGKNVTYIGNLFTGINEIEKNPDLLTNLTSKDDTNAGVSILDIKETKGIDAKEQSNLLNRRAKGEINRAELREQVKGFKKEHTSQPIIVGIAKISCDEETQEIIITISENHKPISEVLSGIEKYLRKEKFTTDFT
jgi:ParB family chromosome partitioning protein